MTRVQKLYQQKEKLVGDMRAILDLAESERRDLSEVETAKYDALEKQLNSLDTKIRCEEKLGDAEQDVNRPVSRAVVPQIGNDIQTYLIPDGGRAGVRGKDLKDRTLLQVLAPDLFRAQNPDYARLSIVDVLNGVKKGGAGLPPEMRAQSVGMAVGGGFSIPTLFWDSVLTQTIANDPWLREITYFPLPADRVSGSGTMPVLDTSTRTKTSIYKGLDFVTVGESSPIPESEAAFKGLVVNTFKKAALLLCSNEFLADSTFGSPLIGRIMRETLQHVLTGLIVDGTGVAEGLGALNVADRIVSPRTTENTIEYADLVRMKSRLTPGRRGRWLFSAESWAETCLMESTSGDLIVSPSQTGETTFLNLPVTVSDLGRTLGSEGDVSIIDASVFGALMLPGATVEQSSSYRFAHDETAFRLTQRFGFSPMLLGKVTPRNGGNQTSWCIVLSA
jgi:HK97 family phage major capsid protein